MSIRNDNEASSLAVFLVVLFIFVAIASTLELNGMERMPTNKAELCPVEKV